MEKPLEQSQRDFLREAKDALQKVHPTKLTWDDFAEMVGIPPKTFKGYRMPESSEANYRSMPPLAVKAVRDCVAEAQKKAARKAGKVARGATPG